MAAGDGQGQRVRRLRSGRGRGRGREAAGSAVPAPVQAAQEDPVTEAPVSKPRREQQGTTSGRPRHRAPQKERVGMSETVVEALTLEADQRCGKHALGCLQGLDELHVPGPAADCPGPGLRLRRARQRESTAPQRLRSAGAPAVGVAGRDRTPQSQSIPPTAACCCRPGQRPPPRWRPRQPPAARTPPLLCWPPWTWTRLRTRARTRRSTFL